MYSARFLCCLVPHWHHLVAMRALVFAVPPLPSSIISTLQLEWPILKLKLFMNNVTVWEKIFTLTHTHTERYWLQAHYRIPVCLLSWSTSVRCAHRTHWVLPMLSSSMLPIVWHHQDLRLAVRAQKRGNDSLFHRDTNKETSHRIRPGPTITANREFTHSFVVQKN